MVFKLIHRFNENFKEPYKIELPVGTHAIGRGKFLDCDDKRVSRNHGQIEVTQDTVKITSLHQNPCFIMKKGTTETIILRQNSMAEICNGDQFGLLPESCWYELIYLASTEDNEKDNVVTNGTNSSIDRSDSNDKFNGETEMIDEELFQLAETEDLNATHSINGDEGVHDNRSDSPSLLDSKKAESAPPIQNTARTPVKRSPSLDISNSDQDIKKVKLEPEDAIIKPDPNCAGPSRDQMGGSIQGVTLPPSSVKPSRERCIYGASCYRKNPHHKAEFSHPSDADWGAEELGQCPYGRECRRRDPRHWRDHAHPPGTLPPDQRPGMQMVQRHGNTFYINAHSVNFYDDHFQVEDSDGDSVDYDYEF